ncbi:hypothetical protein DL93DRAFT_2079518 [Clavulina sp. PMI_390]|nr:hypothetical protein DL93DRAFT_2079518 [Clavulina sp. PMI_390]
MARLHNMIYIYGYTIVEIVRRKEFGKFFSEKSQAIAEVMARISANERKRRQLYKGESHGQLPFDNKDKMDEPTPALEVSTVGQSDPAFSLSKEDIIIFMEMLDQIERTTAPPSTTPSNSPPDDARSPSAIGHAFPHPLKETKAALEKQISRIEGLNTEFDRLMERTVLSPDRLVHSKRRTESDASAYREAVGQMREMREAQALREQQLHDERESTAAEMQRLQAERDAALQQKGDQNSRLEAEVANLRAALERETSARKAIEARHADLVSSMEDKEAKLQAALAEATSKTKEAEIAAREVERARAETEEHHRLQAAGDERLTTLLSEQAETLRKLEEARARGEDLEDQIKFARAEGDEAFRALNEATREKDRLLRTQSMEADRVLRDHIAEADGDRAVLEHQFSELQAAHETMQRELKEATAELDVRKADLEGVREELQRGQHELAEAEQLQSALREEVVKGRAKQDDLTRKLTAADRLLADMLDMAVGFRDTNARLLHSTQKSLSHATRLSSRQAAASMIESTVVDTQLEATKTSDAQTAYMTPIDWSDPVASLQILRRFDLDAFAETVLKANSTIRKWQKQCKEYRDRARGKISFRNFTKGDLALFLPTRNSVAKPWAAFNVSFPHYFLKSTPQVAAQLETREWIVARITSISERVVDHRDPTTNPYGLGNGVKFYMLEVEDYAPPPPNQRRTVSTPAPVSLPQDMPPNPNRRMSVNVNPMSQVEVIEPSSSPDFDNMIEPSVSFTSQAQDIISPNSVPAGASSLTKMLAQSQSMSAIGVPISPPLEDSTELPTPSTPPPAPIITPEPRKRVASGHSHSLIRPSLIQTGSPLRKAESIRSAHSSRPPTAIGNHTAYIVAASPSKAIPTTALADEGIMDGAPVPPQLIALPSERSDASTSSSPPTSNHMRHYRAASTVTPSPSGSASEGLSNVLLNRSRKRTLSTKAPATATSTTFGALGLSTTGGALASLATGWRLPLTRRGRRDSTPTLASDAMASESEGDTASVAGTVAKGSSDARSLLRKLDSTSKQ